MNAFLDKYSVAMTSLLLKDKWFESSLESKGLVDLCSEIKIDDISILEETTVELQAMHELIQLDPAYQVVQWLGYMYPTIIYHHGNNERPFDYRASSKNTFKSILYPVRKDLNVNLITIRAPFHQGSLKDFTSKMKYLNQFSSMIATSTNVVEALVTHLKDKQCPRIIVSGLSLGGWVINLHRSVYNSADVYVPVFAGAALDALFVQSYYSKLVSATALNQPEVLKAALNFESEYSLISSKNVFPLLAKDDQFIEYSVQKHIYEEDVLKTLDKGHITGALASSSIRHHILNLL